MTDAVPNEPDVTEIRATVVQVINEPRPMVDSVTEFALDGEPASDKGFVTSQGDRIRARILLREKVEPDTPTNSDVAVAPQAVVLSLSLALLTAANRVAKDVDGALLIGPAHEIHLHPGLMRGDLSIPDIIENEIKREAHAFRRRVQNQRKIARALEDWAAPSTPV